ncbi:MAG: DUF58 domain-containing protein [Thermomicrobiales bacterium]
MAFDPLRRRSSRQINWRASARTSDLQSKRYEKRTSPSLQVLLDANTFEHFWEGQDTSLLELAISWPLR